jgi:hypothetical protein
MSDPVAAVDPASVVPARRAFLPADVVYGLLDRLADHLAPLFVTSVSALPIARLMAGRAIAAYQPQTQADLISIGRIIAFSMSALAALGRAASEDMAPALQLRYLGRANTLNRSADQSERAMDRRRRSQYPGLPLEDTAGPSPNSVDHMTGPGDAPGTAFDALSDMALFEAAIAAGVAEAANDQIATRAAMAPPANSTGTSLSAAPMAVHAALTIGALSTPSGSPVFDPVQHPASAQRREQVMLREIAASWVPPVHSTDAPR